MKVRSRRDGAAIPLDEADKKPLNLMQGSLPVRGGRSSMSPASQGRPARGAQRVQRLLDKCIVRADHADLRHAGARLQVDAGRRQGRSEYPHRAAKIINGHPGVTHNYLAATISTCGSRLRMSRGPD